MIIFKKMIIQWSNVLYITPFITSLSHLPGNTCQSNTEALKFEVKCMTNDFRVCKKNC